MMTEIKKITGNRVILNLPKNNHPPKGKAEPAMQPTIYTRSEHTILPTQINANALTVLHRLEKSGFDAYLVGGCVRDLLLGREPKDFDVATNASPEEVKKVFRNCRLIGKRFRLAHVYFGREIIEVATFRGSTNETSEHQQTHKDGRLLRDNIYGTLEEDVWRRDFTVNALYYRISDFSVIDYADGMTDHKNAMLRLIGNPDTRYREDPVRMLRAIRFAVKLGFSLHPDCEQPLHELAPLLLGIPSARLYDETLKLFLSGYALQSFEMLRHYGLFAILFPQTEQQLAIEDHDFPRVFLIKALENSDKRVALGKSITPYFLLSAFLWETVQIKAEIKREQGENQYMALQSAAHEVLKLQVKSTAIPKRVTQSMREVWTLQTRFEQRSHSKVYRLLNHPRFRAAYDFLVLRAETGGASSELAQWWTEFQDVDVKQQEKMLSPLNKGVRKYRRRSSKNNASPS
ncbi:MAG: polynucleotide adenylyltransferase PcnB [Methylococcales bacterium]|nr:polynucleotide adenylyltransferase PcnB [Methylococcales bacterium]